MDFGAGRTLPSDKGGYSGKEVNRQAGKGANRLRGTHPRAIGRAHAEPPAIGQIVLG
jgi:hypothetical protein